MPWPSYAASCTPWKVDRPSSESTPSVFVALRNDPTLKSHGLTLEIGRVKNTNKNSVAVKAIAEVEEEILRQAPNGGPISTVTLAIATSRLNSRLRREGLSARKLWTQRDQFTHDQLLICDRKVIQEQHLQRKQNPPNIVRNRKLK